MVPNMAGVHAIIIANAHRRHEKERKEQEEREKREREERLICRKTIPCWACYDEFSESCPKKKINKK
jgi:hypothetical protein